MSLRRRNTSRHKTMNLVNNTLAACRTLDESAVKMQNLPIFLRNFVIYVQYSPQFRKKTAEIYQFSRYDAKVRQAASGNH